MIAVGIEGEQTAFLCWRIGCLVARMLGCLVAWLVGCWHDCLVVRWLACSVRLCSHRAGNNGAYGKGMASERDWDIHSAGNSGASGSICFCEHTIYFVIRKIS